MDSTLSSAETTPATSGKHEPTETGRSNKSKRGLGSYKAKQQKFAERKNQEGKLAFKERIRNDMAKLGVPLLSDEEFLQTIIQGENVNRPPLEVEVDVSVIPDLSRATIDFLSTQKVEVRDEDVALISQVTTLQVRAKVALARAKTPVGSQPINDPYVDKTKKHLGQVLKSQKVLLDQIGIMEHNKQLVVPKLTAPNPAQGIPEGMIRSEVVVGRARLYVPPQYAANPLSCPAAQHRLVDEDRFINLDQVIERYYNLMFRVGRKLKSAISTLDYNNVNGSAAQLIGSRPTQHRGLPYIETWSNKDLPVPVLALGGDLRLGLNSTDPIHNLI